MNASRTRPGAGSAAAAALVLLPLAGWLRAEAPPAATPPPPRHVMRQWTTAEGLPHNGVGALLQTRDGYLWVGTQNGLARFDGVRFRTFGLREGLPHLSIAALLEDRQGGIWIGTEGGLGRLYREQFTRWTAKDGLPGNYLMALAEDGEGTIWVGTTRGLARWRGNRFEPVQLQPALTNAYIRALATTPDGTLWVATLHQGIFRQTREGFQPVPGPPGLRNVSAYTLSADAAGRVWVALSHWVTVGGDRLLCWDNGGWRTFGPKDGLPNQYLTRVVSPADGAAWAGALDQGLYEWRDNHFLPLRRADGLADDAISALLLDHDDNLWVGTVAGGLQRLSARRLETFPVLDAGEERLATTLAQTTDGRLWVGTPGRGLFEWRDGTFHQLLREPPMAGHLQVEAMLAARQGGLWWGAGPALYHWRDGRVAARHDTERWLQGDRVVALGEEPDGVLWVGTLNGQLRGLREGRFGPPINGLAAGPVTAITRTPEGSLWVGSLGGGLNRIRDGTNQVFTTADGLESNLIRTLFVDRDGTLWVGTLGGGLSRWRGGRFQSFTRRHGLADDSVPQILEDDAGFLWLGSNHGLMRLAKSDLDRLAEGSLTRLHPWVLDESDGMVSEQCMAGAPAGLKTSDGRLLFCTARGIALVRPDRVPVAAPPPLVLIEEVLLDGAPLPGLLEASLPGRASLRVPPGAGRLTFRYTGLSFTAPEKVRFRCQLEGVDADWLEVGAERTISYSQLRPGDYTFRVTACNRDGVWSETGAALGFSVQPHFWQTWWFVAVLGVSLVGGLAGGIRFAERRRYQRRLRRLETERAMEQERARIARDMHDELGARLTQISLLSALTRKRAEQPGEVQANTDKIAGAARELTRSLDEIVWAVRPQNDHLESLVEYLGQSTRDLCEGSPVRCWFTVPDQVPARPVSAQVRHNLVLACREAVNNVIKHAAATELRMRVRLAEDQLTVEIADNGQGFDVAAGEAKCSGLVHMRQRLADCGGECRFTSTPGAGTRVEFTLRLAGSGTSPAPLAPPAGASPPHTTI